MIARTALSSAGPVAPAIQHPLRPGLRGVSELIDGILFYGILGFGFLVPIVSALYAWLFR